MVVNKHVHFTISVENISRLFIALIFVSSNSKDINLFNLLFNIWFMMSIY